MFLSRLLVKQSSAWEVPCHIHSKASTWLMTSLCPLDSRAQRIRVLFYRTNSWSVATFIFKPFDLCEMTDRALSGLKPFFSFFQANGINLALENGYVILSFNNKMWKSSKQYHDGQWHYLTVTSRAGRYVTLAQYGRHMGTVSHMKKYLDSETCGPVN